MKEKAKEQKIGIGRYIQSLIDNQSEVNSQNSVTNSLADNQPINLGLNTNKTLIQTHPLDSVLKDKANEQNISIEKYIQSLIKTDKNRFLKTSCATQKRFLDLTLVPLTDPNNQIQGIIIITNNMTEDKKLRDNLKKSNEDLQTANEKRETTNEDLKDSTEMILLAIEDIIGRTGATF